jgi:ribosomal protein L40E
MEAGFMKMEVCPSCGASVIADATCCQECGGALNPRLRNKDAAANVIKLATSEIPEDLSNGKKTDVDVMKLELMEDIMACFCTSGKGFLIEIHEDEVKFFLGGAETAFVTALKGDVATLLTMLRHAVKQLRNVSGAAKIRSLLVKFTADETLGILEMQEMVDVVLSLCDEDASIIWGQGPEEASELDGKVKVVLAVPADVEYVRVSQTDLFRDGMEKYRSGE